MDKDAVIFDMDGLLLDSERAALDCWCYAGAALGLRDLEEVFLRCVGTSPAASREILRRHYGAQIALERFDELSLKRWQERCGDGLPVKPGAAALLEHLRARGVTVALASSTPVERVRRELCRAGLLDYFHVLVGGDMVSRSKPAPDIFLHAAALCGAAPGRCWVLEDSFNGVRAGHAAGMQVIMVPDLLPPDGEMAEKAEVILPDLLAVKDYLAQRLKRVDKG